MTTISDNLDAKIVLTPMAPGRDAEFAEMLDEFRAASETHVYGGNFAVAWEGYGPFYESDLENEGGWLSKARNRAHGLLFHRV